MPEQSADLRTPPSFVVVLNWVNELKRLVAAQWGDPHDYGVPRVAECVVAKHIPGRRGEI
jgi:hypothetical protein